MDNDPFKKSTEGYIRTSAEYAEKFRSSKAGQLALEIMRNPETQTEYRISSTSRNVYLLPGFGDQSVVLKLEKRLTDFTRLAFEALFISTASGRFNTHVPEFILLPRVGLVHGIVMEDISGAGVTVTELVEDSQLPFKDDIGYKRSRFEHIDGLWKVGCYMNLKSTCNIGDLTKTDYESTSFVAHKDGIFRKIVAADFDQIYGDFESVIRTNEIASLEPLVVDLSK